MYVTEGYAIEGDEGHWKAECPVCGKEYEWEGFFDSGIIETCDKCKQQFQLKIVWINENTYIEW